MNIDNIREDLRTLQNSIYVDVNRDILNNFLVLEKNINILNIFKSIDISTSFSNIKEIIFKDDINKSDLFNETLIIDNYLEEYSIDYHKKNNNQIMAKIVDPDDLFQGTDVLFDPTGKTIEVLASSAITAIDGVTLQCVYSFCKEEWKDDPELIKYPFPLIAITAEQFELFNSWNWTGSTADYLRDGGWALKDTGGTSQEEYMNLTTLGSFNATADTAYYLQTGSTGFPSEETVYPNVVNQAIKIYGDVNNGNFDYRTYFKIYLREQAKSYDFYDLIVEQNLTELTYKKYALPLSNSTDLKITHDDSIITGTTPYSWMSITYTSGSTRTIGATDYIFDVIIDGSGGTAEQIYEFVQYQLRNPDDIDAGAGAVTGKTADELLIFVGDTLRTLGADGDGVYIDNFLAVDTNRLEFTESGGTVVTFPFVAAGNLLFNDNLTTDASALYWVFFTDANGNTYDSPDAIIINDNSGVPLSGSVSAASIAFDYDYDGNVQGGRTAESDAPFTAVSIGLSTGQYVKTTGTLTRSTANSINFVAALERNYSNPA